MTKQSWLDSYDEFILRYILFLFLITLSSFAQCQTARLNEILKIVTATNDVKAKIFIKSPNNETPKAFILNNRTFLKNDNEAYNSLSYFNGGPYFYLDDLEVILFKDWATNLHKIPLFIIVDKFRVKVQKAKIEFHTTSIVYNTSYSSNYISVSCSLINVSGVWEIDKILIKEIKCCDKM